MEKPNTLPKTFSLRVNDRGLIEKVRQHRRRSGKTLQRIGEDALRVFFAAKGKSGKEEGR